MSNLRAVKEGVPPAPGAVDELVTDHHRPRLQFRPQAPHGAGAYYPLDTQGGKGEKIGPEIDLVRGTGVVPTVAWEERHRPAPHPGQADGVTRPSIWRVRPYLFSRLAQGVQT